MLKTLHTSSNDTHCSRRTGATLIELTATMVTSAILITGLTSSILMSQKSLQVVAARQQGTLHQRQSIEQLRADLREATAIDTSTADTVSLTVPDRTGDATPDVVSYAFPTSGSTSVTRTWSGLTTPYSMGTLNRTARTPFSVPSVPPASPALELRVTGYSTAMSSSSVNSLVCMAPPNTLEGDMLVVVFGATSQTSIAAISPGTWNSLINRKTMGLQLQVWWKLASANETGDITFTNSSNCRLSATVIRITNHNGTIVAHTATNAGTSSTPPSAGCATTSNNMLSFRVLMASDDEYIRAYTGLYDHTNLIMQAGDTFSSALTTGIGYRKIPTPTASTSLNFRLLANESYITGSFAVGSAGI